MTLRSEITFDPETPSPFPPCGGRLGWGVGAEGAVFLRNDTKHARYAGASLIPTLPPQEEKG